MKASMSVVALRLSLLHTGPSPLRHHLLASILVKPRIHVNPNLVYGRRAFLSALQRIRFVFQLKLYVRIRRTWSACSLLIILADVYDICLVRLIDVLVIDRLIHLLGNVDKLAHVGQLSLDRLVE